MPAGSICGSRVRYAGYGRRLTCAVPVLIRHHFHDCKAPLARASHVKWRYTKYLGFSFSFLEGRVDGRAFPLAELTGRQQLGPSTRVVETGLKYPYTFISAEAGLLSSLT